MQCIVGFFVMIIFYVFAKISLYLFSANFFFSKIFVEKTKTRFFVENCLFKIDQPLFDAVSVNSQEEEDGEPQSKKARKNRKVGMDKRG